MSLEPVVNAPHPGIRELLGRRKHSPSTQEVLEGIAYCELVPHANPSGQPRGGQAKLLGPVTRAPGPHDLCVQWAVTGLIELLERGPLISRSNEFSDSVVDPTSSPPIWATILGLRWYIIGVEPAQVAPCSA